MAAAASVSVSTPFVWQQGLIKALKGTPQMSKEEFLLTLRKIVAARQEGKLPLGEENLTICQDKKVQNTAWNQYKTLNGKSELIDRASLLTNLFFTTVANTDGCNLTPKQKDTAQNNYLPKAIEGVKKAMLKDTTPEDCEEIGAWFTELTSNQYVQGWFKDFALAGYSKVIDALDKLYEGLEDEFRKNIESAMFQIAKKHIMPVSTDELKSLIHTIEFEKLNKPEDDTIPPLLEGTLWTAYVNYQDMAGEFSPEKQQFFWETRVLSLQTFLNRKETK